MLRPLIAVFIITLFVSCNERHVGGEEQQANPEDTVTIAPNNTMDTSGAQQHY